MASSTADTLPPLSALQENIDTQKGTIINSPHPAYLHHLASQVLHDLQYQHDWTHLTTHTYSPVNSLALPRPVISGVPPRRAYIHPDEQVEILKEEHKSGKKIQYPPEREWVLPSHIQEKTSLANFAAAFDALSIVPPGMGSIQNGEEQDDNEILSTVGHRWQGENRQKRLLLATLHDDSTITYYIVHDGIVKPRQN